MKRPQSLHEIMPDLFDLLLSIPAGSCSKDNQRAAAAALVIAEQFYGRNSWQYAQALCEDAYYGNEGKRRRSFANTVRRAIRLYQACGAQFVKQSGYEFACYDLALELTTAHHGKHRAEICRLLIEAMEFERRHGLACLTDDCEEMLKVG